MTCAWLVRGPVSDPRALAGVLVENTNVQTRQNTVYTVRICSRLEVYRALSAKLPLRCGSQRIWRTDNE